MLTLPTDHAHFSFNKASICGNLPLKTSAKTWNRFVLHFWIVALKLKMNTLRYHKNEYLSLYSTVTVIIDEVFLWIPVQKARVFDRLVDWSRECTLGRRVLKQFTVSQAWLYLYSQWCVVGSRCYKCNVGGHPFFTIVII